MGTLHDLYFQGDYRNRLDCDKETVHSYIGGLYEKLFEPLKDECLDILEIGVKYGGSIKLWNDFFTNSTITGIDIEDKFDATIKSNPRIKLLVADACLPETVNLLQSYDFIIDDGSHKVVDQAHVVANYQKLLKTNGVMIIEDVENDEVLNILHKTAERCNYSRIEVVDLRHIKGRYDDLMLVLQK